VYGIRVNTISPGYIVTKMVEALFAEYPEREDEWPKQNMLNRLSKPEEYRGAAVFLISDASSFSKCALFLESAMLSQNVITTPSSLDSN
jgi:NAD(P)-dependent dehydrogenase (short-subunit alcohol dehydrogenase family)